MSEATPTAQQPRTSRRRRRIAAIIGAGATLAAAIGIAALLVRAPVTGSGSIATSPGLRFANQAQTQVIASSGGPLVVSAALDGQDNLNISFQNALPGAWADVQVYVEQRDSGDIPLKAQSFQFSTATLDSIKTSGGTGPGTTLVYGTSVPFVLHIEVPIGAPAGAFTAQADAGFTAVDASSYSPVGAL